MDVYSKMYPDASEHQLVNVGRLFTCLIAVLSVAWLPVIDSTSDQLFLYIQSLQVIWCAPIALVFLGARFLPSMSTKTAWYVLIFGSVVGVIFWIVQNVTPPTHVSNYGF